MERKHSKISLSTYIISLIVMAIFIMIITFLIFKNNNTNNIIDTLSSYEKYYTISYTGSPNNHFSLPNPFYKIVKNKSELDSIYKDLKSSLYSEIFDDNYFKNNDLLIIPGAIDSTINSLIVTNSEVNVVIYYASPLTTADQEFNYNVFFIPINKSVKNITINDQDYPDRVY